MNFWTKKTAEAPVKIWGAGTARSLRPIWVAEELGLDYELAPIGPRTGETQTKEYTELNRKQKIPFLVDGEVHLFESVAICRYLIMVYPNDQLSSPEALLEKVKEDEWVSYIYGEIDETSLYVMRRHRDLADIYGASEDVVQSAPAYVQRHFGVLAKHLEHQQYLMERGFSLPDVLLMSCLDWAVHYEVPVPQVLQNYRNVIAERPAYQKAMAINYKDLFGG